MGYEYKIHFLMYTGLINETCSLLRPHSGSTSGCLSIGTSLLSIKMGYEYVQKHQPKNDVHRFILIVINNHI